MDETGNIYITGRTDSADFPITPGAYQTTYATETDAFVTKFDSGGNLVYSTYLGGTKTEYGYSIAVDNTRNIYVSGYTSSANLPITPDAYQTTNAAAPGDISYDAFFASMTTATTPPTYTITASAGANGTIDPSGDVAVNEGDNVTFIITPVTGYRVADVLVDGASVGAVTTYEFTNVTAAHTIEASFAIDTFVITASAGADGSIDPSGDVTVNYGASQSFSIAADSGYHVADVLVDGGSVGAVTSYTFTGVTATHTISASFAETVPDWDLNGDHVCNIGDVVSIGLHWNETGTTGWIPQDLNNDGVINIGDIVVIGLHWGESW